ncbi:hypothetical protein D3C74_460610 [compost metagenome]
MFSNIRCSVVRQRTRIMADCRKNLGSFLLDFLVIVIAAPHLVAQSGICPASLFRGRRLFVQSAFEFVLQSYQ